jgi:hypothetical protein
VVCSHRRRLWQEGAEPGAGEPLHHGVGARHPGRGGAGRHPALPPARCIEIKTHWGHPRLPSEHAVNSHDGCPASVLRRNCGLPGSDSSQSGFLVHIRRGCAAGGGAAAAGVLAALPGGGRRRPHRPVHPRPAGLGALRGDGVTRDRPAARVRARRLPCAAGRHWPRPRHAPRGEIACSDATSSAGGWPAGSTCCEECASCELGLEATQIRCKALSGMASLPFSSWHSCHIVYHKLQCTSHLGTLCPIVPKLACSQQFNAPFAGGEGIAGSLPRLPAAAAAA